RSQRPAAGSRFFVKGPPVNGAKTAPLPRVAPERRTPCQGRRQGVHLTCTMELLWRKIETAHDSLSSCRWQPAVQRSVGSLRSLHFLSRHQLPQHLILFRCQACADGCRAEQPQFPQKSDQETPHHRPRPPDQERVSFSKALRALRSPPAGQRCVDLAASTPPCGGG